MSQASKLLSGLSEDEIVAYAANSDIEEHIIIDGNRHITVPDNLKRIAVQYDHNIETVTFDCPRYWDGHDMSKMIVYISYKCPDGILGSYIADNVRIDDVDDTIIHFDWTISNNVTMHKGDLAFLVCIKNVSGNGLNSIDSLNAVAYGNDTFVAGDINGNFYYSKDGLSWNIGTRIDTKDVTYDNGRIEDIVYGNGRFVAACTYTVHEHTNNTIEEYDSSIIYYSEDGIHWTSGTIETAIRDIVIIKLAYGAGTYIAFDKYGSAFYSFDGITWEETNLHKVAGGYTVEIATYCNGRFIASRRGLIPCKYYISIDGITWIKSNSTIGNGDNKGSLKDIVYGRNKFVAISEEGYIFNSTDGDTWNEVINLDVPLTGIRYSSGKFIIFGENGSIYYSENGTDWNRAENELTETINSVTYGDGKFIAVGDNGAYLYSFNGEDWLTREAESNHWNSELCEDMYISEGLECTDILKDNYPDLYSQLLHRMDENESIISNFSSEVSSKAEKANISAAIASGAETNAKEYASEAKESLDNVKQAIAVGGMDTVRAGDIPNSCYEEIDNPQINSIIYDGKNFIAAGNIECALHSTDGKDWNRYSVITTAVVNKMVYGNGVYVAVGDGFIEYSSEGVAWRKCSDITGNMIDVAYGNGVFVAVEKTGDLYKHWYSEDGVSWRDVTVYDGYGNIRYLNNRFIYFSKYGNILTSKNGIKIDAGGKIENITGNIFDITYGDGLYIAVGGHIDLELVYAYYSTDLVTWNNCNGVNDILRCVTYANGKFVAGGDGGSYAFSTNGIDWQSGVIDHFDTPNIKCIATNGNTFVIGCDDGHILYAEYMLISDVKNLLNDVTDRMTEMQHGITGPQGEQGPQGDAGPQGEKGEKGEKGDAGSAGLQGPQGIQGPQGEKGDAGLTGPAGPQGVQGPKGDTGEQGPQGPKGESGIMAPVNGFFTISVDEDGNIWAISDENGTAPNFEYDVETGNLYLVQEVE